MKTTFLTTSVLLATLLFSGCGGGAENSSTVTKQPHDTSKLGRTVSQERDWTWDVSFNANVISGKDGSIEAHFWQGVPDEIENFQIFIDMDNDATTGYSGSNGWEIHGADYLIENGDVYEATSTTEWKWELRGSFLDVDFRRLVGEGRHESLYMTNLTPTLSRIFTSSSFKVMIEAYDANWEGDCNTITGVVADVTGVDETTGSSETTTGSTDTRKVLIRKSIDEDNDGIVDFVTNYTYYDNGKLKTQSSGNSIKYYNNHGDLIRFGSNSYDSYRYVYNNEGKIRKKEYLNSDGTVNYYEIYDYNEHGDLIYAYKNGSRIPSWYSKYEYNADGKILKREDFEYIDYSDSDYLYFTETFKYDNQNRVIEYFADSYDSNPIHYKSTYNSKGKEIKRVDLSSDDDGVSFDSYFEYDSDGYLKVEKIDKYVHVYQNGILQTVNRGDIDQIIYYEWK